MDCFGQQYYLGYLQTVCAEFEAHRSKIIVTSIVRIHIKCHKSTSFKKHP